MIPILFILGTCLASFTTLVAQRLLVGQTPWHPQRSYCDHCRQSLVWWQLIPIVGYCLQRGHCHYCRAPVPIYSPITELLTGLSFTFLAGYPLLKMVIFALAILTLLFIATTDYFAQCIFPCSLAGLLPLFLVAPPNWEKLSAALITASILLAIVWWTASLGSGDVELLFILCLILGWQSTIIIIQGASVLMLLLFLCSHEKQLPFIPAIVLLTLPLLFLTI